MFYKIEIWCLYTYIRHPVKLVHVVKIRPITQEDKNENDILDFA